jgi:hypothetical protein
MTNSDLKKFAIFINSKNDLNPSLTKSDVTIPFTANLANHDPMRTFRVSIVDCLFSNIFYNVRPGANTLKIATLFAAGRNKAAYTEIQTIRVPYGFYSYDTITEYLNASHAGRLKSDITYTGTGAPSGNQRAFFGFGSYYPDQPAQDTNDIPASSFSTATAKCWFQTPSLGDLYQAYKADNSLTPSNTVSNIYAGFYLIEDTETYGLMHQLGYSFQETPPPLIPNTELRGYGTPVYFYDNGSVTAYSFKQNTLAVADYGVSTADARFSEIQPQEVSDLTGLDDLYIHCPQFRTQYQSSIGRAPQAPNDVVAVIPINVEFAQKMSYIPQFPLECYLQNTNITQLQFRMTNSNNIPLDFHGINWQLTMFCEEMEDASRLQLEDNPDGAQPDAFSYANVMRSGGFMENRLKKRTLLNNR